MMVNGIEPVEKTVERNESIGHRFFVRLNRSEINQHMIFLICFFVLVLTGFMVKIPEDFVKGFGRAGEIIFLIRGIVHRIAGTTMILMCFYHMYYLLFKPAGRRWLFDILPAPKDLFELRDNMLYMIGVKKDPPKFDRFSYKHKIEYLGLISGSFLMSMSGLILWFEFVWDKFIIDIASLVHQMEAILAFLTIMVWHLYEVHLRPRKFPIDDMWLTGVMDEEEMMEEHALHYERIINDPELQEIYVAK